MVRYRAVKRATAAMLAALSHLGAGPFPNMEMMMRILSAIGCIAALGLAMMAAPALSAEPTDNPAFDVCGMEVLPEAVPCGDMVGMDAMVIEYGGDHDVALLLAPGEPLLLVPVAEMVPAEPSLIDTHPPLAVPGGDGAAGVLA